MKKYNPKIIEPKWQKKWESENIVKIDKDDTSKEKYYALDMFPYPSGDGLHMGHTENYIPTDIVSRYKKMCGFNVLHPQGFDSFGLPAENYAIKTGTHPSETTKVNITNYIKQMKSLALGYDFDEKIVTSSPEYYKWTQWIFTKFFENDLVYRKTDFVNWCKSCKTVLANEQVLNGACERCKNEVIQKEVPSWFFKITDFADELIEGLECLDWPEHTKKNQINWIGKSEGAEITFGIKGGESNKSKISNILIIDGCGDDEKDDVSGHWQPWLKQELKKNNISVVEPQMPTFWNPNYDEWKKVIEKSEINENTVLIGHSCGASFLVRWIGDTRTKVRKLILVAPCTVPSKEFSDGENDLYDYEIDKNIKDNIKDIIVFTSNNEEKEGKTSACIFKETLNARVISLENHGHFVSSQMGTNEFPELLEEILQDSKFKVKSGKLNNNKISNVVIVHGSSHEDKAGAFATKNKRHWFPWVKKNLGKAGIDCIIPLMPKSWDPKYKEWKKEFEKIHVDKDSVLVGTSAGGTFLIRWLGDTKKKVKKLILVAAVTGKESCNKWVAEMGEFEIDSGIQDRIGEVVIFVSDNDKEERLETAKIYQKKLNAKLIELKGRGHFIEEHMGTKEFPELLEEILQVSKFKVFTTRPDTLFGATYCVLAPEHELVDKLKNDISNWDEVVRYIVQTGKKTERERVEAKEKTGVELKGVKAINPANDEEIPIFIADYVLAHYGTGAIMAVPAHDERDFEFAKKFGLTLKNVVIKKIGGHETVDYERIGVYGIIKNVKGQYLIQRFTKIKNYWWPGGGIEENESEKEALIREIKEETGYVDFEIGDRLSEVVYDFIHLTGNKKCRSRIITYEIKLLSDEKKKLKLDYGEASDGMVSEWLTLDEVIDEIWKLDSDRAQVIQTPLDVLSGRFVGVENGILINSGKFDGLNSEEAKKAIVEFVGGKITSNYRLRDWSVSRQRYWGTPIPIVYDPEGKAHIVPEEHLPWILPEDVDFMPTGVSPLVNSKELKKRTEKIFGKGWTPDTDTLDTFVDSSWYFLRYPDVRNEKEFASKERLKHWLPVDLYIGGAEHTYLHLLYARFFTKAMKKIGVLDFDEPFLKLRHQGLVLDSKGVKMSKSKGNVINPDEIIKRFGADATRLYTMFSGPLSDSITWNDDGVVGTYRFLEKIWKMQEKLGNTKNITINQTLHKTIKKVTEDIKSLDFNTAISAMMILANTMNKEISIPKEDYEVLIKLLAPFAPHITEEIWEGLGYSTSVHLEEWPKYKKSLTVNENMTIAIQINGKLRDSVELPIDTDEKAVKEAVLSREKVQKWIKGKDFKRIVYVPERLVNIVI